VESLIIGHPRYGILDYTLCFHDDVWNGERAVVRSLLIVDSRLCRGREFEMEPSDAAHYLTEGLRKDRRDSFSLPPASCGHCCGP